mgnify:CR=1 FL=1
MESDFTLLSDSYDESVNDTHIADKEFLSTLKNRGVKRGMGPRKKAKKRKKVKRRFRSRVNMINKNKNKQLVNVRFRRSTRKNKYTVRKKRRKKQLIKKTPPIPPIVTQQKSDFIKETLCLEFILTESSGQKLLWSGHGIEPTGTVIISNKSAKLITLIVKQIDGTLYSQAVQPYSEFSFTITRIIAISAVCNPSMGLNNETRSVNKCKGELRLHLFIPMGTTIVQNEQFS